MLQEIEVHNPAFKSQNQDQKLRIDCEYVPEEGAR